MTVPVAVTGQSTPYRVAAYLTLDEFKEAPTGVDLSNLVVGGVADQQDARISETIARASSWADSMCGQVLGATLDTEAKRIRSNRNGEFVVHPNYWPVIQVTDFRYGGLPSSLSPLADLSNVFVEPHGFTVAVPGLGFSSSQGPIQFGPLLGPGNQVFAQWTYVNGYANTVLLAPAIAGDVSVQVVDPTGILANITRLTIFDGSSVSAGPPSQTERGLQPTAVVGNVVTLASPLLFDHKAGVSISALPDAVKQAVILLTKTLIMTRGTEALVSDDFMGGPHKVQSFDGISEEDVAIAAELLDPFARVR
jgi:hypothetical protein